MILQLVYDLAYVAKMTLNTHQFEYNSRNNSSRIISFGCRKYYKNISVFFRTQCTVWDVGQHKAGNENNHSVTR